MELSSVQKDLGMDKSIQEEYGTGVSHPTELRDFRNVISFYHLQVNFILY